MEFLHLPAGTTKFTTFADAEHYKKVYAYYLKTFKEAVLREAMTQKPSIQIELPLERPSVQDIVETVKAYKSPRNPRLVNEPCDNDLNAGLKYFLHKFKDIPKPTNDDAADFFFEHVDACRTLNGFAVTINNKMKKYYTQHAESRLNQGEKLSFPLGISVWIAALYMLYFKVDCTVGQITEVITPLLEGENHSDLLTLQLIMEVGYHSIRDKQIKDKSFSFIFNWLVQENQKNNNRAFLESSESYITKAQKLLHS